MNPGKKGQGKKHGKKEQEKKNNLQFFKFFKNFKKV